MFRNSVGGYAPLLGATPKGREVCCSYIERDMGSSYLSVSYSSRYFPPDKQVGLGEENIGENES